MPTKSVQASGRLTLRAMADEQLRPRDREAFGRAMAAARAVKGMSQSDVARELQVAQPTVSEWEKGTSEPSSPAVTFRLEEVLGLEPGELSHFLGYLPVSAAGSVEAALSTSEVDEKLRQVLLNLYREIKRQSGR